MGNLSADLKAIHKAGAVHLASAAEQYRDMAADSAGLEGLHAGILANASCSGEMTAARQGATFEFWTGANVALGRMLAESGNNMQNAADVLRMVAYEYAETDDEAADDLKKAAGLDGMPEYRDGEWR